MSLFGAHFNASFLFSLIPSPRIIIIVAARRLSILYLQNSGLSHMLSFSSSKRLRLLQAKAYEEALREASYIQVKARTAPKMEIMQNS
jgi:hypothetical protein